MQRRRHGAASPCPEITRRPLTFLVVIAMLTAGLATLAFPSPASATFDTTNTVVIPAQSGNQSFEATPGMTALAGYGFDPSEAASTVVDNASAVLSVSCKNGRTPTQTSVTIPIGHQEYADHANSWIPSSDLKDPATYQGSFVLGDYCAGTTMVVGATMGPFTADVYSSSIKSTTFRWHYGPTSGPKNVVGVGSAWSATKTVVPEGLGGYGADLQIIKTDLNDPIRAGENITYSLVVRNASQAVSSSSVTVYDGLDATTTFVSATGATCSTSPFLTGTILTCNVGTLAPGATRTITIVAGTSTTAATDAYAGSGAQAGGLGITCPTSDLCNKAYVTASTKDPDTSDNSYYQPTNVAKPGITLDKTVADSNDADTIGSLGETLTYGFKVTNTGNLPLSNVTVTDSLLGLTNAACVSSLAAGASTTCPQLSATTYKVAAADIARGSVTNTASAAGAPASGAIVSASDTETISTPAAPAVQLTKTVADSNDADTIASRGETLTYGFTVKNTGNVPLSSVTVSDAMLGLTNATCATSLEVGASVTCQSGRTWTVTTADIGRGEVANTASAGATAPGGSKVTGSSTATIPTEAAAAAVVLTKTVADSNDADQIGSLGETLTYGFTVTNTGNVVVTGVTVTDSKLGLNGVACVASLEPGASATCPQKPTYVVTADDIGRGSVANTATARATTSGGKSAEDPDTATISTPAAPAISLVKRVADSPDAGSIASNDETLTYTFVVTNTGNVPLSGVTISDPKIGLDQAACVATLAVGATATCPTSTYSTTSDDVEDGTVVNTASTSATSPAGTVVGASETARITTEAAAPSITLVKTAKDSGDGDGIGSLGEKLSYTFKVTNTGNVALKNLTITDTLLGLSADDCAAKLAPKASTTCPLLPAKSHTVSPADIAAGSVVNTAKAAGASSKNGTKVTAQDSATVATPAVPAVSLAKSVSDSNDVDAVGSLGETLTYGFVVTNTGNVPLRDVSLTDPSLGVSGATCASTLAVGASAPCSPSSKTHTVTGADIEAGSVVNTATSAAVAPSGARVTDDDSATVATESPLTGIALRKSVADSDDADSTGSLGENLTYGFTVTNTGNVPLTGVTVTDAMLGLDHAPCVSTLDPGATTTCLAGRTHTVGAADIDAGSVANTATAAGTPARGPAVSDDDRAVVQTPAAPSVVLDKDVADSADSDSVGSLGETLTYTFRVTNNGNQPLRNITLDDPMLGLTSTPCVSTLAVGATATCTGRTYAVTASDLARGTVDNTATATGASTTDRTVTARDTATLPTEAALPAIALEKTVRDSSDAGTTAALGETLTYAFTVTNNGNLPLRDVTVTDTMLGLEGAACTATLAVGASATCLDGRTHVTTSGEVSKGSVDNTASTAATSAAGAVGSQGTASIPTDVPNPAITLAKSVSDSADPDVLGSLDETLTYAFTVTNNGNVPLTDVTVSDAMLGLNGAACVPTLAPGASSTCPQLTGERTHRVTADDVAHGSVDNTATASARANGSTVTDQDSATMPTPSLETPPAEDPGGPFNWDWRYPAPTCDALTVTYPRDLPGDQANDINVRIQTDVGEVTLNFHNNEGFWSGTTSFPYLSHPRWPAGATTYTVVWTQVAGTNYHWQGAVRCGVAGGAGSPTPEDTRALTQVTGWRTGSTTLDVGQAPGSDAVEVTQLGFQSMELEQRTADGGWRWVKTVPVTARGTASVVFPKITEKGVTAFRLRVDGSQDVTGATTAPFQVRAR
ncbi:MAG: conserved repeat domain protein [Nocardioides sp.]|nr:conserved repeat domain protein [Nocardioides sp.]